MNLPRLAIDRPVFVCCLVLLIVVLGIMGYRRMGVDQFPDVNMPFVVIRTPYPGAGPEEIETQVTKPLEDELSTLQGVKELMSMNFEGLSIVWVQFHLEVKAAEAEQRVRDKVSYVRPNLPETVEEPLVRRYDPSDQPIAILSLQCALPDVRANDVATETIRPRLAQVTDVGLVEVVGGRRREIRVALDRERLYRARLTAAGVARRIAANGRNVPVGKYEKGAGNLLFRALGEYRDLERIRQTVVNFTGSEVPVTVAQLGAVTDAQTDPVTYAYFNGQPTLFLRVYKQSGANTVRVVERLRDETARINRELEGRPGRPKLELVWEGAWHIAAALDDVWYSIAIGIGLTIVVVFVFLGSARSTLITITALPVSLIGAFMLMNWMGFTINLLSLMALSLAVGLLIDDAIVVRENIWRHLERGLPPREAALTGANEVALAVVATTTVVIAVFMPIGFLRGLIGQFFREFGFTVCFAMAISLFEAMTMGPMLSAYGARGQARAADGAGAAGGRFIRACERLHARLAAFYGQIIRWTLAHRLLVVALTLGLFVASLLLTRIIKFTFMPDSDPGECSVALKAAPSTALNAMRDRTLEVERLVRAHPEVRSVMTFVGSTDGEANVGTLFVRLVPFRQRARTTSVFMEALREELAPYRDTLQPQVGHIHPVGGEAPFALNLMGDDMAALERLARDLVARFKTIPGLRDLTTNYDGGKEEYQFRLAPDRLLALGVAAGEVGQELRAQVEGVTPAVLREGGLEYDIRVRLQEDQRDLQAAWPAIYVPNQNGDLIRLADVAEPLAAEGPAKINRWNRQRFIQIAGQLGPGAAVGALTTQAQAILDRAALPPGVRYAFIGDAEDLRDVSRNMFVAFALAILFTYLVLASLYESPILPLAIMLAIPMAVVGAFVALYVADKSLNIFSMIALVMLIGLVTKNSILLVDFALHLQRQGVPRAEALERAGAIRLRPILMTTLALITGMLPLALALTEVGRFRQSMGVAVLGGLISSLFLTLLVVPAMYGFIDDFRLWLRRLVGGSEPRNGGGT